MAVSIKYIILTTAIIVTIITIITSDIFTPPQGGKYPPPSWKSTPPSPNSEYFFVCFSVFQGLHPPQTFVYIPPISNS